MRLRATDAEALMTVRQVFAGTTTREQVVRLPARVQAYVGVAIMLTFPERYLNGMEMIRSLNDALRELLCVRNPGYNAMVNGIDYPGACRSAGFYTPSPGRGGRKLITLTPPAALTELLAELGVTPAAREFYDTAQAAVAAHQEAQQRSREVWDADVETHVGTDAILELIAKGGYSLKRSVYHALRKDLYGS